MAKRLTFNQKALRRLIKNRKIDITTGCWIWIGKNRTNNGYGRLAVDGKRLLAHRLSMYLWRGFDYNSDLLVLHKNECNNSRCFNPDHLYLGDHKQNSQDTIDLGHTNKKEFCINGHRIDSLYRDDQRRGSVRRYCKLCRIERVRKWRAKQNKSHIETP